MYLHKFGYEETKYECFSSKSVFVANRAWSRKQLHELIKMWGYFPPLDYLEILSHLGEHTYNLKAAQRIIESHLWDGEVNADVKVKFVELSTPGRIKLIQTWSSGKIDLDMTIEIAERYRSNSSAQMAIIAHEYAHAFHYLRDDFTPPDDNLEYENLTDLSTIALGMGELTLQGRIVKEGSKKVGEIGYLSGELLDFSQDLYKTMKKKYPSSSSMPHATIRPGKEVTWIHEEPSYTAEPIKKKEKPIEKRKLKWEEDLFVALFPHSGKVIPLGKGTVLGRTFAKENFLPPVNTSKISRKQIDLKLEKDVLSIINLGKNPVKVEFEQVFSLFNFRIMNLKVKKSLAKGGQIKIVNPPVKIYLPENDFFILK
jgi:hypothetical protein